MHLSPFWHTTPPGYTPSPSQDVPLFRELEIVRSSTEEPLISELASMATQLSEARGQSEEARTAASDAVSEARLAKLATQWAEDRLAKLERCVQLKASS